MCPPDIINDIPTGMALNNIDVAKRNQRVFEARRSEPRQRTHPKKQATG